MTKANAIKLIDEHKNKLLDPVEMLNWTWLRVIVNNLTDDAWNAALKKALPTLLA